MEQKSANLLHESKRRDRKPGKSQALERETKDGYSNRLCSFLQAGETFGVKYYPTGRNTSIFSNRIMFCDYQRTFFNV